MTESWINNLTILISVHENQEYFHRCVKYYNNFPCAKFLLDSSSERLFPPLIDNPSYTHSWMPNSNLEKKLSLACNWPIDTKYILYVDHDDFYPQKGIEDAIEFLDMDNRYSCACGQVVSFKNGRFDHSKYGGAYAKWLEKEWNADPKQRLVESHLIRGVNRLNSVCRINNFRDFWRDFPTCKTTTFMEHAANQFFEVRGGCKMLPIFFAVKQHGGGTKSKSIYDYRHIYKVYNDPKCQKDRIAASDFIANDLVYITGMEFSEALQYVNGAYQNSIQSSKGGLPTVNWAKNRFPAYNHADELEKIRNFINA